MSDIRLDGVSKRYGAVGAAEGKTDQDTAEAIEKRAEQAHELAPGHDATVIGAPDIIVAKDRPAAHPFRPQVPTKCCAE